MRPASAGEADGVVRFTVSLGGAGDMPVTVAYHTEDGTATAGEDYAATSGRLTFRDAATELTARASRRRWRRSPPTSPTRGSRAPVHGGRSRRAHQLRTSGIEVIEPEETSEEIPQAVT